MRRLLLALVLLAGGCARTGAPPSAPDATIDALPAAAYALPRTPDSIVVAYDRTDDPASDREHGLDVATGLRHFSVDTRAEPIDEVSITEARNAGAVVLLGDPAAPHLTPSELAVLRAAKRLVVTRAHLAELHAAGVAFAHIDDRGTVDSAGRKLAVMDAGERVAYAADSYVDVAAQAGSEPLGILVDGNRRVPFAVTDGTATFVNADMQFEQDPTTPEYAQMPVVCGLLAAALGAEPRSSEHIAMVRLEDVSVQTPAKRLRAIVAYFAQEHIPYGIGVIPEQLIKGETLSSLRQDPELMTVLRWAQDHGATIILHGLHHSFNSPEDFEFWDNDHDRPLPQDSVAWMRGKLDEGLRTERSLGLDPLMWETPHYSASPLDYRVTKQYFAGAWERREPSFWMPWVLQSDAYGQRLLPEDLGYIAVALTSDQTLDNQLQRARELLVCDECIAAGFLHPSTVHISDVVGYVQGLKAMGYRFADPKRYLQEPGQ